MRPAAFRLAMLAVALHAALLGAGRVICLDAAPLSWLRADCAEACCATAESCCPEIEVKADGASSPRPKDCCVSGSTRDWLPSRDTVRFPAPAPAPAMYVRATHAAPTASRAAVPPRPHPPPTLVGVVVLQI